MENEKSFLSGPIVPIIILIFGTILILVLAGQRNPKFDSLPDSNGWIVCNEFNIAYYKQKVSMGWNIYVPVIGPNGACLSCTEYIRYIDTLKKE